MSCDIYGDERKNLYAFATRLLKGNDVRSILDIACGGGEGTALLAEAAPSARIVGLDIDAGLIGDAEKNFNLPNLQYVTGDARRTPFRGGKFDCVISFHTVEHFSGADQKIFLGELCRILQPGGKACIATPDRDVWALQGIAGAQEDHIKELNQKEFAELVREAGFAIDGMYGQSILKSGTFPVRRFLNALKKLDVLHLRRLLGKHAIGRVDQKTQPVYPNTEVVPLRAGEKASVTVLVCKKM